MEKEKKQLLKLAEKDTYPEIPLKIRWKSRFFGQEIQWEYLWNYYTGESAGRIPFYLPYIYLKEEQDFLRRYARLPRKEISLVIIDSGDERTEYLLYEIMEQLNYLTLITERREYFTGFSERAFQELGLLVDLYLPWQEKEIYGNLVWDLTENLQKSDCYPKGSLCFLPHKNSWKKKELEQCCGNVRFLNMPGIDLGTMKTDAAFAETLLVPEYMPFRKSRCDALKQKCRLCGWKPVWNL